MRRWPPFESGYFAGGGVMALSGLLHRSDAGADDEPSAFIFWPDLRKLFLKKRTPSTRIGNCGYCLGVTQKQEGWNPEHPIAEGISAVGAFQGRVRFKAKATWSRKRRPPDSRHDHRGGRGPRFSLPR